MKLSDVEDKLVGRWIYQNGKMEQDDIAEQIVWLIRNHLKRIVSDSSGWIVLFQDPDDDRFWELSYPHGEWHGGGPPMLTCIQEQEAKKKYSF